MMTRAAIVTRWVQVTELDGTTRNMIGLGQDALLLTGETGRDVTEQPSANIPPRPNVLIVEVNVSDATLTAIKANAQYGQAAVLWEGDPSLSPVMTANANTVLVNFLANKFNVTTTQVQNILTSIGCIVNGILTRYDFAVRIIGWLRTRPHA